MPKIIKDIEKRIINSAIYLFENNRYEDVDMKAIAGGAGIAVGTLYNYYSDKKDLFMNSFKISWNTMLSTLEDIKIEDGKEYEIFRDSVLRLYDGVYSKRFMFHEMMISTPIELQNQLKNDLTNQNSHTGYFIRRDLLINIENGVTDLIEKKLIKIEKGMEERFVGMIFMDVWGLVMAFPDEKEANKKFLTNIIDLVFY